jgi:tripartite-type tricarboxylate transporter receptor subunit TctC
MKAAVAFGGGISASIECGFAQVYPLRPITVIVPIAAGSSLDVVARLLADHMKNSFGQAVVVENVTGAGGSIGAARVARAKADGYVLSIGNWNTHVGAPAVYPVQYDPLKDFEPVSRISDAPAFIVSNNNIPATSLTELIAWLRANPDKASAATVGVGSAAHLCAISFQNSTGTRLQFVPYRGGAPAVQDLVAGQVELMCADATNSLPHARAGKIRAYAIAAKNRLEVAPDIPTVDEAGLPGFYFSQWVGLWTPKGRRRTS